MEAVDVLVAVVALSASVFIGYAANRWWVALLPLLLPTAALAMAGAAYLAEHGDECYDGCAWIFLLVGAGAALALAVLLGTLIALGVCLRRQRAAGP